MIDLSVIIVSYNVRYYLEQCLRSVFAAKGDLDMEVFVVDNNSADDSVAYLQPRFPEVHFIVNAENRGFSKANNQAIRQSKGRYILLLNPDTIITEHTLRDCVEYLDQHAEVGATGVSMYGDKGRFAWESRRGIPTPWTAFCKMVGLTALFPHSHRFGRYYMRYLDRTKPASIEVISGAFNMLRREAIQQVGMLDEDFFMYGEDIDISYRLLQGGWKNAYVPTPIIHYKGESTQKSSYRYVHIFYEAMLIFFDKHFKARYRLVSLLIRWAVYLRAAMDMLKRLWQKFTSRVAVFFSPYLPLRSSKTETCICIGTSASLEKMRDICNRNHLLGTFVEGTSQTLPKGHLAHAADSKCMYVIYDMSVYRYDDIIALLIHGAGQGLPVSLGTYHPQTGLIILLNDVYQ